MELKHSILSCCVTGHNLLIVPYGIETYEVGNTFECDGLLIVPYGIETALFLVLLLNQDTFNRTLWN